MRKIYILLSGLLLACSLQAQLVTGITIGAPFASNMAGMLGQVSDMTFTASVTPAGALDKTVTWSITSGTDVAEVVDAAKGIVKALKGGSFTIQAAANDASGITKQATYIISDSVPVLSKGLFMNFNTSSPTNLYLPEHDNEYAKKTDSSFVALDPMPATVPDSLLWMPVYKVQMTPKSMKMIIDKAGPMGADGKPAFLFRRQTFYRFSAMRISICPAYNTLIQMPSIKKINIKLKSSSDLNLQIGWCSYNFRGNTGNSVTKVIAEDTATYRVYSFDFTNKTFNTVDNVVDSNNISHLYLNFNPDGAWSADWWKLNDCKATLEIEYISFGEMALVVPVEKITISGPTYVEVNRTGKYNFDILPSNASNQDYVIWSTSDPAVATIDGSGKLTPVSQGTVKVIATSADKDNNIPVYTTSEYDVTIGPPNALSSFSTDFFITNPINDKLLIGGASDLLYVDIITLSGITLKSIQNTSTNHLFIDMTDVPSGIYLVKCFANNGEVITKKIIKQ